MGPNVIMFGWNRSIPGRERTAGAHFQEFVQYLAGLQQGGVIQSFDVVFLNRHGGDMNGFFLIRGECAKLNDLAASADWIGHMIRANLHTEGCGVVHGVTGDAAAEWMRLWASLLPA